MGLCDCATLILGMMVAGMSTAGIASDVLSLSFVFSGSGVLFLVGALLLLPLIQKSRRAKVSETPAK